MAKFPNWGYMKKKYISQTPLQIKAARAIRRIPLPSTYVTERLTSKVNEFVLDVQKWYPEMSEEEARAVVNDDSLFQQLLRLEDKHLRLKLMKEMVPILYKATKTKADAMYTDTALKGMVSIGIGMDKVLEKDGKRAAGTGVNIGAENAQVNIDWKPKWMKKKKGGE